MYPIRQLLFSILIFLGCCPVLYCQSNPLSEVAILNYTGSARVLKFEKLELGVKLPADIQEKVMQFIHGTSLGLNPFLEWELRVQAVFTHSSGLQKTIEGFYYRETERDPANDTWTHPKPEENAYPFRIRFAPPLAGDWTGLVNISVNKVVVESTPFSFQVIESANPGYVSVHPNKKNLVRDGAVIYPVGVNLPFPFVGNNMLYNWSPERTFHLSAWENYSNDIRKYADQGGKYIRIFMEPSSSEIEFEHLGNYNERLNFAWEMDQLIKNCEDKGVLIDFNMMLHTPLMKISDYGTHSWDFGKYWPDPTAWPNQDMMPAYCYQSYFHFKDPHEMILNAESFRYIEQRYRYMIARWGYSTSIYLFELVSEPWHLDQNGGIPPYLEPTGTLQRQAVQQFHAKMSTYIKEYLGHTEHLLGAVGTVQDNKTIYSHPGEFSQPDESWKSPNIDVVCVSPYAAIPDKLLISKSDRVSNNAFAEGENSFAGNVHRYQQAYQKPVFFSENGHGDNMSECAGYIGHFIDLMTVGFVGASGFNMWEGFTYPLDSTQSGANQPELLWPATIRTEHYMNTSEVLAVFKDGNWVQGREMVYGRARKGKRLKEQEYYVSGNRQYAAGVVKNRTFNVYTMNIAGENSPCIGLGNVLDPSFEQLADLAWDERKLHVEGLKKKTSYTIRWYSYKSGELMSTDCIKTTSRGKTALHHPELWVTPESLKAGNRFSPLLWYVIEESDCKP